MIQREKKRQQMKLDTIYVNSRPSRHNGSTNDNWYLDDHIEQNWSSNEIYLGEIWMNASAVTLWTRFFSQDPSDDGIRPISTHWLTENGAVKMDSHFTDLYAPDIVLTNTATTTAVNGTIKFDGNHYQGYKNGNWYNFDNSALSQLSDVTLGPLSNGQVLTYSGGTWINANDSSIELKNTYIAFGSSINTLTGTSDFIWNNLNKNFFIKDNGTPTFYQYKNGFFGYSSDWAGRSYFQADVEGVYINDVIEDVRKFELSKNGLIFGDFDTDGTWRIMPSGSSILIEYRTGSTWITRETISYP